MLGGLWYGPLFGKLWLRELGRRPSELGSHGLAFAVSLLALLLGAVVLALLAAGLGLETPLAGAGLGLLVGAGLVATAKASDFAYCRFGVRLWAVQAGYRVVWCMLAGALLATWR